MRKITKITTKKRREREKRKKYKENDSFFFTNLHISTLINDDDDTNQSHKGTNNISQFHSSTTPISIPIKKKKRNDVSTQSMPLYNLTLNDKLMSKIFKRSLLT